MKNFFSLLISFILLITLLILIIITLLFIDLLSIIDKPSITYSSPSYHLDTLYFEYNKKSSIFDPFIDSFNKYKYFPSYFVKTDITLNCTNINVSLLDVICNKQYCMLDRTYEDLNKLHNDLANIIKEYRSNSLCYTKKLY